MFAPVGMRNRLQKAVVERTLEADGEHAPYDIRFIKEIASRCETRSFVLGGSICTDLGGIRYDDRHYTRFHRVAFCFGLNEEGTREAVSCGYALLQADENEIIPQTERALLVGERAKEYARAVIAAARGEENGLFFRSLAERLT